MFPIPDILVSETYKKIYQFIYLGVYCWFIMSLLLVYLNYSKTTFGDLVKGVGLG